MNKVDNFELMEEIKSEVEQEVNGTDDTEDADADRPSFQSRTTMSVEFYHVYKRLGAT